jgi:hypothetical protein
MIATKFPLGPRQNEPAHYPHNGNYLLVGAFDHHPLSPGDVLTCYVSPPAAVQFKWEYLPCGSGENATGFQRFAVIAFASSLGWQI